jgi:hypothetical protein
MTADVRRRGGSAVAAVLAALVWALGFAVWTVAGSGTTTCTGTATGRTCSSAPLIGELGPGFAAALAPALVCVAAWVLLRRYCVRGARGAHRAAGTLVALLAAFCLVSIASIGLLLLPTAVLLAVATATTEPPAHRPAG